VKRSVYLLGFLASLAVTFASPSAWSQAYPVKPVRIITTFAPGSVIDITARTIAQRLSDRWGQPVTVENRPGGGGTGTVGTEFAARSPADGYTWLLAPNSVMIIGPHLVKTPFDVFKDFIPVGQVATTPFLLVVSTQIPVRTVQELVDYAKANPGKLNYGSSGNGSPQHLGGELLKRAGGIDMTHIPYKGAALSITDLISGRLQVFVGAAGSLLPHIRDGKIRLIASAGNKRLARFPDVPTIAEALPGVEVDAWLGLFLPAGSPKEVVTKINADVAEVLGVAETRAGLSNQGIEAAVDSPEALATLMRNDFNRWGRVIREANIKAD
jgi:tripartite-type tricarboxylate transporter receptor subunit TctC